MYKPKKDMRLEIKDISVDYGGVQALSGVNMYVRRGEIVAILGPNAAGKSTLVYTIAGIVPSKTGEIIFEGKPIQNLPTEQIVRLGISVVPEGKLLFLEMKALENLELGAYRLPSKVRKRKLQESIDNIFGLFPILKSKKGQLAGSLSGGQQQMIAIGRGLMSKPRLLLLDEPSLGLAPVVITEVMDTLSKLREEQELTILLSEQNAVAALGIADRGYILAGGEVIMEGSSDELQSTKRIQEAYLGEAVK